MFGLLPAIVVDLGMKSINVLFWLMPLFFSCTQKPEITAQHIIDEAIKAHGGDAYTTINYTFTFRDKSYSATRKGGEFRYNRMFADSIGNVEDVLTNNGFIRYRNGQAVELDNAKAQAYQSSVNSVHYFNLLPFGLNDEAVNKKYLGIAMLDSASYHKIKVTFSQEGGGEDFEDEFIYWFNTETATLDYLAYSYEEENKNGQLEKGYRFRKAYNPRVIGGIRFQDYINYKPSVKIENLEQLEALYHKQQVVEVSRIETTDIQMVK